MTSLAWSGAIPRRGLAHRTAIALTGIVAAGAALRFWGLGDQSFWYDEVATTGVLRPSLFHTLGALPGTESTPPVYYVLAWAWTRVAGVTEVGLRSLSALVGTATIGVAFAAGREAMSARAGLFAAAIVAVNPMLVWYSQEARAYSLLALVGALSFWLMQRALRAPTRAALAAWSAACVLALLTHYFAAFLVFAEAVTLLWMLPAARRSVTYALVPIAVVALALVPLARNQEADGRTTWIAASSIGGRLGDVIRELASASTSIISSNSARPGGPWGAIGYLAVLTGVAGGVAWARGRDRRGVRTALLVGAVAIAVPLALSVTSLDYFKDRNLIAAWIPLAVALGGALAAASSRVLAGAAMLAIALAGVGVTADVHANRTLQRSDWRDAVHLLGAPVHARAVIVTPAFARIVLRFYGHQLVPLVPGTRVRELAFIGTGGNLAQPPPSELVPIVRRRLRDVAVVRYAAPSALTMTPALISRARAPVLFEASLAGQRWLTGYLGQVRTLRTALARLGTDPRARQALAAAPSTVERFAAAPEELVDGPALVQRLRAAAAIAADTAKHPGLAERRALAAALAQVFAAG